MAKDDISILIIFMARSVSNKYAVMELLSYVMSKVKREEILT